MSFSVISSVDSLTFHACRSLWWVMIYCECDWLTSCPSMTVPAVVAACQTTRLPLQWLSAQTIHALRILRSHGVQMESIHTIYRVVVIAKLAYASSAWWGFTTATDRQRLDAVIRRGIRSGLSSSNQLSLAELVEDADDDLFSQVLYNNSHVLNSLLPMANTRTYNLRQRPHNRTLVVKPSSLTESDFILRMLHKRIYWLWSINLFV